MFALYLVGFRCWAVAVRVKMFLRLRVTRMSVATHLGLVLNDLQCWLIVCQTCVHFLKVI